MAIGVLLISIETREGHVIFVFTFFVTKISDNLVGRSSCYFYTGGGDGDVTSTYIVIEKTDSRPRQAP